MDFIQKDAHTEHDVSWSLYSTVHNSPVCLGCIVETIENQELLPLQRKPALTEFQQLLLQQQTDVLQLFMQEERIVWHVVSVLLDSLVLKDEVYVALCIEVLLKIIQIIGSDDLVTSVLDKISHQVDSVTDHMTLLPHYTLIGKLIFQLPALVQTLLSHYDLLLYGLSMDLCNGGEAIQSAVAYIFIFLCEGNETSRLSTRVQHQLHTGVISMLSTAQTLSVQINGLGLLKKLVVNNEDCQILMSLCNQQMSLLSCLKKILLCKKDVLQTAVCQIFWLILKKENYTAYATAILQSDVVEFLFESLHTDKTEQIESIFKVLQRLSSVEQFYKRCHSVYGVESILRALTTSIELKHPSLLKAGYSLLTDILNRHPDDVPLFLSGSVVKKCLNVIQHGLEHHQTPVFLPAQDAFSAMLRRRYMLSPVPFKELKDMFSILLYKNTDHVKVFINAERKQHTNAAHFFTSVEIFLEQIIKCCKLISECRDDLTACENNYTAPDSQNYTPSFETFTLILIDAFTMICSLMTQKVWDMVKREQFYIKFLEAICSIDEIEPTATSGFCFKIVSSGALNGILDVKVKHSIPQLTELTGRLLRFISDSSKENCFIDADLMASNVNVDHIQWPISALPKVFTEQTLDVGAVEINLWIIFLSYKFDNCIYTSEELAGIISSITSQHTTLDQLIPIARKHYIFLLAYLGSHGDVDIRQAMPNCLHSKPAILQGACTDWYTHDTIILEWIFNDPVLAATSGQAVIEAFINASSMESLEQIIGSDYNESDVINRLCCSRTFIGAMMKNLATCRCESVPKYQLILVSHISSGQGSSETTDNLSWMNDQLTTVLQDIFLKNYPDTSCHNLVGLLHLLLQLSQHMSDSHHIDVKVLYHVLHSLCKNEDVEEELFKLCLLTILTAITTNTQSQISVCGIVTQHEGFMKVLQKCISCDHGNTIYCIATDILTILVNTKNLKTSNTINVDVNTLIEAVCQGTGDIMVASLNLLTALFDTDLSCGVVDCVGRIYNNTYRSLHIHLQQTCLQDIPEYASSAVQCMRAMVQHLNRSETEQTLADELMSQPWNTALIEVTLDLALSGTALNHHYDIFTFFLESDKGDNLMKSVPGVVDRLLQMLKQVDSLEDTPKTEHSNKLIQVMVSKWGEMLAAEELMWLKSKC